MELPVLEEFSFQTALLVTQNIADRFIMTIIATICGFRPQHLSGCESTTQAIWGGYEFADHNSFTRILDINGSGGGVFIVGQMEVLLTLLYSVSLVQMSM